MRVIKRDERELVFSRKIDKITEELQDKLFWKDLYIYSDFIEGDPEVEQEFLHS